GAAQGRVLDVVGVVLERLDLGEGVAVGQRLVDLVLGLDLLLVVLVLAADVGVPPGEGGLDLQRAQFLRVSVEELLGAGADVVGGGSGERPCQEQRHDAGGRQDGTEAEHGDGPFRERGRPRRRRPRGWGIVAGGAAAGNWAKKCYFGRRFLPPFV